MAMLTAVHVRGLGLGSLVSQPAGLPVVLTACRPVYAAQWHNDGL